MSFPDVCGEVIDGRGRNCCSEKVEVCARGVSIQPTHGVLQTTGQMPVTKSSTSIGITTPIGGDILTLFLARVYLLYS